MLLAITLISFNLRISTANDTLHSWASRREAVVAAVTDLQPDVLCVQECSIEQDSFLVSHLSDYTRVPIVDSIYHSTQIVNAFFYRKTRFRLLRSSLFWLSPTPHFPSTGWGGAYPRVAVYGLLQDTDGQPFLVVNTHLDHISAQARSEGLRMIADTIAFLAKSASISYATDSLPCFLTGDFNTSLPSPLTFSQSACAEPDITLYHPLSTQPTFHNFGQELNGGVQIDYIFYLHATLLQYRVIHEGYGVPYLSDHYPILSTFNL